MSIFLDTIRAMSNDMATIYISRRVTAPAHGSLVVDTKYFQYAMIASREFMGTAFFKEQSERCDAWFGVLVNGLSDFTCS